MAPRRRRNTLGDARGRSVTRYAALIQGHPPGFVDCHVVEVNSPLGHPRAQSLHISEGGRVELATVPLVARR